MLFVEKDGWIKCWFCCWYDAGGAESVALNPSGMIEGDWVWQLLDGLENDEEMRLLMWGLMVRGVGLTYAISFLSMIFQVVGIVGSQGVEPFYMKLDAVRKYMPSFWEQFKTYPSIFHWIPPTDFNIQLVPVLGFMCSVFALWGGELTPWWFVGAWILLHTCDTLGMGLSYPWDALLLEFGSITPFFPALPSLSLTPSIGSFALAVFPAPILAWQTRWLVFRLMIGFGRVKFSEPSSWLLNRLYIKNFYIYQPMTTYVSWLLYRFPDWFHIVSILFMFASEIITPFFLFWTGPLRAIGAASIVVLMIAIWATGNYGYFNLLTMVLCIGCLDLSSSVWEQEWRVWMLPPKEAILLLYLVCLHLPSALFLSLLNSWVTFGGFYWPALSKLSPPWFWDRFVSFLRLIQSSRLAHAYGVFPPQSSPPSKWVFVIEGSNDGLEWLRYEYKHLISHAKSRPVFVVPHHPRLDHAAFYDGLHGLNGHGVMASFNVGVAFNSATCSSFNRRIVARLLDHSPSVRALFANDPFPTAPPRYVRASLYMFRVASLSHWWNTGEWWVVRRMGEHFPPIERGSPDHKAIFDGWLQPPETWVADSVVWKKRASTTYNPLTREDLDTAATFLGLVRRFAAQAVSILPTPRSTKTIEGDFPHPSNAVQTTGRGQEKTFESARPMIDQKLATKVFTWKVLRQVRGGLRLAGYDDIKMQETEQALGRIATVLLARLWRVFHRATPSEQEVEEEIAQGVDEGVEEWEGWEEEYGALRRWIEGKGGRGGVMGSAFRLQGYVHWMLLVGGLDWCFDVGKVEEFVGEQVPLFGGMSEEEKEEEGSTLASVFVQFINPDRLHPAWMSDENCGFLTSLLHYDSTVHTAQHCEINEHHQRVSAFEPIAKFGDPLPGWTHLIAALARQRQLRRWDAIRQTWCPALAVPTYEPTPDGKFLLVSDGLKDAEEEEREEHEQGAIPSPPEDFRCAHNYRVYGVPSVGPADGEIRHDE